MNKSIQEIVNTGKAGTDDLFKLEDRINVLTDRITNLERLSMVTLTSTMALQGAGEEGDMKAIRFWSEVLLANYNAFAENSNIGKPPSKRQDLFIKIPESKL